jgi:hypothetical protein
MTTSASIDFSVNRDLIITESLMHLGVLPEGGSPTANQLSDHARTLNIMVKRWMGRGINLWAIDRVTLALVTAQTDYITGTDTFTRTLTGAAISATYIKSILECNVRNTNGQETPVMIVPRKDYFGLSNKTTSGQVNQIYFQPNLTSSTVFVYPAPSNSTDTLRFIVKRTLEDFDAAGDTPDFPQEWYEALYLGLAYRLSRVYRVPLNERLALKQEAEKALEEAEGWDREQEVSVQITPSWVGK